MISGINHIGIAVRDLEVSKKLYTSIFGVVNFHEEEIESQKVKIASFKVGNVLIELTQATSEDSPIYKFISKKGEGIHHIAFTSQDINLQLANLSVNGIELINQTAVDGAHGAKVAFLHPKSTGGVLMELCQPSVED